MALSRATAFFCALLLAGPIAGCGTRVPEIQEFWGEENDTGIKINAIVTQIECELREGVREVLKEDSDRAIEKKVPRKLDWLKEWGAQLPLILTIEEKSALSPGLSFISPFVTRAQSFSLGLGGSVSSDATRVDKLSVFYKLSDFVGELPKSPRLSCVPGRKSSGTLFVESDLKLRQWLRSATIIQYTDAADYAVARPEKDVISHEVKFNIVTDGNITPTWKLVRLAAKPVARPFSTRSGTGPRTLS